jgi:hypothetical protein
VVQDRVAGRPLDLPPEPPEAPVKRCVVNYANGGWYPYGQARLAGQCTRFGVDFIGETGDVPCGYAPHFLIPYAFKAAMVELALARGYETVCWMDASANVQHDPTPLFEIAERLGAFVSANYGIKTGKWSSDACLAEYGLSREEAWNIEHCSALVCAFCPSHTIGGPIWNEYSAAARKGTAFVGPHSYGVPSSPCAVEGHRHDQTVLSIIANKYHIPLQPNGPYLDYGRDRPAAIVAAYPWEARLDG